MNERTQAAGNAGPKTSGGQNGNKESGCLPERKKMEALGRLSCRAAHDFNNILSAIEGYATLAAMNEAGKDKQKKLFPSPICAKIFDPSFRC